MKRKIIILYAIFFSFGLTFVKAIDGMMGFAGYELPISKGELKTNVDVKKTEESYQFYRNNGVIDLVLGNRDDVEVKVYKVEYKDGKRTETKMVNWVNVKDNSVNRIQNLNTSTDSFYQGTYTISLRRHTWCVTKASHSGGWYLNESILRREESI